MLLEPLGDNIVYSLVVLELGREDAGSLLRLAKQLGVHQVDAVSCSEGGESTGTVEHAIGVALIFVLCRLLGSIAAALILLAEGLLGRHEAGRARRGGAEGGRGGAQGAGEGSRSGCHGVELLLQCRGVSRLGSRYLIQSRNVSGDKSSRWR